MAFDAAVLRPQLSGHAFELTRTFTPRRDHLAITSVLVDLFSQKRVRQSLVRTNFTQDLSPKLRGSSRTLPPTFLFLQSSIVKEQTSHQTQCRGSVALSFRPSRVSLTRLSWIRSTRDRRSFRRSELRGRQRRAALVVEAYI